MGTGESQTGCAIRFSSAGELKNFWLRLTIDELEQNTRPIGCVKLAGAPDLYRVRGGDYRIVYQADDARLRLTILSIAHRRDVYRR